MNPTPYLYLIPVFIILIISVLITNKFVKINIAVVVYPEIDGIRGYLAFFVFLHHSFIWQGYLKTSKWEEPILNLFNHFGQTSVSFFFIITAFLFTLKLINATNQQIDWKQYIKSRFYRLFPMYFFSIILVFFIAAYTTHFEINASLLENTKSVLSWLFFTVSKSSNINGLEDSFILNAGVTWTLPYEWIFYFLLPLLSLFFKIKINYKVLFSFTLIAIIIMLLNKSSLKNFIPFIGGILVAVLISSNKLKIDLKAKRYTFLSLFLLFISIYYFHSAKKPIPIFITSIVFLIIASGNTFFGILSSVFSRKLGQITYSLYLLHGIILFVIFNFLIGFERAKILTDFEFWSIITLSIFPLILFSQLTFKYIELPLMSLMKRKIN